MAGIVIELQQEILKQDCDVVNILRKAHVIASKLQLNEFDTWILHELNGYPDQNSCPEYRQIRGVLKAFNPYNGWIPTNITNQELEDMICNRRLVNSISEIVSLCEYGNNLISEFNGGQLDVINSMFDSPLPMKYSLHISRTSVLDIVEKVKNTILEWTLRLESEGILGEGMRFSDVEKNAAQDLPQTINYYFGDTKIVNTTGENTTVVEGDNNSISFSYDKASKIVDEIEEYINSEDLSEDDLETVGDILADIRDKISKEKKPSIIKASLSGLKDFLIGAGANIAAGLIQAKI